MTFASFLTEFQLICFDFDGLLVNTERVHQLAYEEMLKRRGFALGIDFLTYMGYAHDASGEALAHYVLGKFPTIKEDWETLRNEKKAIYSEMIRSGTVELMPGAAELIDFVTKSKIPSCIVTNSSKVDTDIIRAQLPLLNQLSPWFTKETYDRPKPHPDGYLTALRHFPSIPKDKAIGFDDALKGIHSLKGAGIFPILVCPRNHPQMKDATGITHLESLQGLTPAY